MLSQGPFEYNRFDAYEKRRQELEEVAQYQPPPQMPAPQTGQEVRTAPQPETRKAPTVDTKQSSGRGSMQLSDFGQKYAAKGMDQKYSNTASILVDHARGVVHRQNDGLPYEVHRTVKPGSNKIADEKYYVNKDYTAANPFNDETLEAATSIFGGTHSGSDQDQVLFSGLPIEEDDVGAYAGAFADITDTLGENLDSLIKSNPEAAQVVKNYESVGIHNLDAVEDSEKQIAPMYTKGDLPGHGRSNFNFFPEERDREYIGSTNLNQEYVFDDPKHPDGRPIESNEFRNLLSPGDWGVRLGKGF